MYTATNSIIIGYSNIVVNRITRVEDKIIFHPGITIVKLNT